MDNTSTTYNGHIESIDLEKGELVFAHADGRRTLFSGVTLTSMPVFDSVCSSTELSTTFVVEQFEDFYVDKP